MGNDKRWIHLNVGGTYFATAKSTLSRSTPPNSPLHRISTNSTNVEWDRDERGAYKIDRDPEYFQSILNYLRHGQLVMNKNVPEEAVLIEAEYFHIPGLINLIKERILIRNLQQQIMFQPQQQQAQQPQYTQPGAANLQDTQDCLSKYISHIMMNEY